HQKRPEAVRRSSWPPRTSVPESLPCRRSPRFPFAAPRRRQTLKIRRSHESKSISVLASQRLLCLLPERFHFFESGILNFAVLLPQPSLYVGEAFAELQV